MAAEVTRDDIVAAAARIEPYTRRTPIIDVGNLISDEFSLVLKLEHLQVTGSFKPRGAVSILTASEIPPPGVVAASGGNFGIAIAYAAQRLGHAATVFVPEASPREKIARIGGYGADVRAIPGYYDEALAAAREFAEATGAFEAHAYDQHQVMAGQGTLAREVADQTELDVIVTAVGGGGLIGGIASWFRDEIEVVAAEPEQCRSLNASLEAGEQVEVEVSGVAASSLGSRSVGDHPWSTRAWIDDSVLVTDDAIVDGQRWLWSETRLAVEPAAAVTIAALRTGAFTPANGSRVVAVLSGGNLDPAGVV
ncbi:MAG: serine/threonine dehydratase [Acidimicrobiia bacterium]